MRARHRVYLGLGSNLDDRADALRTAIQRLAPLIAVDSVSSMWDTAPELVEDQPRFLNAAIGGWTELDPLSLLHAIKRLERAMGRRPAQRYGPRLIDIDILLYDDLRVDTTELVIPHPRLAERIFVLAPLAEIAPDVRHPVLGETISELLKRAPRADVQHVELPPG